ncbi:MAG: two-component system, response regulator YesN [Clostridia bacterium]|nr:helix-turn-helix-domain containing protein AraC type [Clostridiales bacterium]MDK2985586.1 two-component system, response regulator YesN [Clostridia bacterium]
MTLSEKNLKNEIYDFKKFYHLIKAFTISTNISCKAFNLNGEKIASFKGPESDTSFCKLIQKLNQEKNYCMQSYIYGGQQSEKLGEAYIYFCPYGLVNWTVPVIKENKVRCFLTAGPVLMHEVDNLLVENAVKMCPMLDKRRKEIKSKLSKIIVVDTIRVKYLADLLLKLAKIIMAEDAVDLNNKHELNIFNAHLVENINEIKRTYTLQGKNNKISNFQEKEANLITKVTSGDKEGAKKSLNQFLGYIFFYNADNIEIIKCKVIELMIRLLQVVTEVGVDYNVVSGIKYKYLKNLINAGDFNEISKNILEVLDYLIDCLTPLINVKNRNTILIAINYIRNNYHKDINLEEVAAQVGLHPVNLSKMFKKETGKKYTDYLNEVRIEASKNLLLRDDLPLVQVAFSVGFNDQSYFSKIFKKIEGVSPNKWRVLQKEQKNFN